MSKHVTPGAEPAPPPHPLAAALALALAHERDARLLLLGVGNGRNVPPFCDAGVRVDAIEADATRASAAAARFGGTSTVRIVCARYAAPFPFSGAFAGALSTSALLHGTADDAARAIASVRDLLRPSAPFYATLGSTADPRFGRGTRIDDETFASHVGSEAGVPHAYVDGRRLRELFAGFTIDEAIEGSASETVGRWAHAASEAAPIVHWFVKARRLP